MMKQIYEQHLWGGSEFDFYSGYGSHELHVVEPYIKAITKFLKSHDNQLTICDLGCGDFNIGKQLLPYTRNYIGVDIVPALIERNKQLFQFEHLELQCLDLAKDELPKTDCVILRQVLQHLSNTEINAIVKKLSNYKYIILTEHLPTGNFIPNKDIITGQGIRLKQQSGVNLLAKPFNLKIKHEMVLNEVVLDTSKGTIKTMLYTMI